jgi:hypothetical protein
VVDIAPRNLSRQAPIAQEEYHSSVDLVEAAMLELIFECHLRCFLGEDLGEAPRDHSEVGALRMPVEAAVQQSMTEARMAEAGEDSHHRELARDMQDWLLAVAYKDKLAPAVGTAEQQVEVLRAVAARRELRYLVVIETLVEQELDLGR